MADSEKQVAIRDGHEPLIQRFGEVRFLVKLLIRSSVLHPLQWVFTQRWHPEEVEQGTPAEWVSPGGGGPPTMHQLLGWDTTCAEQSNQQFVPISSCNISLIYLIPAA